MLGKLLKYDFRSMWKQFAFIWPAALVLALVNRFTIPLMDGGSQASELTAGISMLVYVAVMMAMFVVALIFVIQRFYKGLLGDEGYLMHTLPVRPWQLIASKLLCAMALTILSILVAILSVLLLIPASWSDYAEAFLLFGKSFVQLTAEYPAHTVMGILELLLVVLTGLASAFLHLYLAMAIGHLFSKNRIAASVIAYVAINAAVSLLTGLLGLTALQPIFEFLNETLPGWSAMAAMHGVLWGAIIASAVLSALYFFAAEHILRKHLNLE